MLEDNNNSHISEEEDNSSPGGECKTSENNNSYTTSPQDTSKSERRGTKSEEPLTDKERDTMKEFKDLMERIENESVGIDNGIAELRVLEEHENRVRKKSNEMIVSLTRDLNLTDIEHGKATIGSVKYSSVNMSRLAICIHKKVNEQTERHFLTSETVVSLLNKKKILQDRLQLLHRPYQKGAGCSNGVKTSNVSAVKASFLKKKRQQLEQQIDTLKDSYNKLVQLDVERQQKAPTKTLDEYMELKLKAGHAKINAMKENISKYNQQLSHVSSMIDARQKEMSELKRAIKSKATATIEESKEYQTLIDNNKELKRKLDELLLSQDIITEETRRVLNEIEEEKRNIDKPLPEEVVVRESLNLLDDQYENRVLREPIDDEIIADLEKQVWARDVCLTHLQTNTHRLKDNLQHEKERVALLMQEIHKTTDANKKIIQDLSTATHEQLQRIGFHA